MSNSHMTEFQFIKPELIRSNMLNNDEMVKNFVSMYLSQCGEDFEHLSQAIANQNRSEIASKAHHIKPTMEYIGATDVRMQFQHIENMAKGQQKISDIQNHFKKLETDFHTLMEELGTFYASLD